MVQTCSTVRHIVAMQRAAAPVARSTSSCRHSKALLIEASRLSAGQLGWGVCGMSRRRCYGAWGRQWFQLGRGSDGGCVYSHILYSLPSLLPTLGKAPAASISALDAVKVAPAMLDCIAGLLLGLGCPSLQAVDRNYGCVGTS